MKNSILILVDKFYRTFCSLNSEPLWAVRVWCYNCCISYSYLCYVCSKQHCNCHMTNNRICGHCNLIQFTLCWEHMWGKLIRSRTKLKQGCMCSFMWTAQTDESSCLVYIWTLSDHCQHIKVRQASNVLQFVLSVDRLSAFSAVWIGDSKHQSSIHLWNINIRHKLKQLDRSWGMYIWHTYECQKSVKQCQTMLQSLESVWFGFE